MGSSHECHGCGDFVQSLLEWRGQFEECVAIAAAVSVGWTVIAGSSVVGGNSIHWLEKRGRFEENVVKSSIKNLYASTLEIRGKDITSVSDFIHYYSNKNQGLNDWLILQNYGFTINR